MAVEFELKYGATSELLEQLRQRYDGEEKTYRMCTTYYDTPTEQFSARHCTLRCRLENEVSVCTLKMPTGGIGRREWEVECGRIEDAIEELCKLGAPQEVCDLAKEGLVPICGARFERIAKLLKTEDCLVELALDAGVLIAGDRQIPLCEVEVELKEGDAQACVDFAREMAQSFGLKPEKKSKFRRALDLYRGEK